MARAMSPGVSLVNVRGIVQATALFRRAIRNQWRVIHAIMLRETRVRNADSNIGYRTPPVDAPLPVFLITGIFPFSLWRSSVSLGGSAAKTSRSLLIFPQVTVLDYITARVLLEAATALIVYHLFMIVLIVLYDQPLAIFYDEPLQLLMAWSSLLYISLASAFFSSGLTQVFPLWPMIFSYLGRLLFLTSGIFFTLGSLPSTARRYAVDNPLAHLLEWIRSASLNTFESSYYSVSFILISATVLMFIGLGLDRLVLVTGRVEPRNK